MAAADGCTGRNRPYRPSLQAVPILVAALQDVDDRRAGETTHGQKARLLGALGRGFGKAAVLLAPNGLRASQFGLAKLRADCFDQGVAHRVPAQFADDPARPHARRAAMDEAISKARIGQPAFALERIEQWFERVCLFGKGSELAREFGAAVFASRQIVERTSLQRAGWFFRAPGRLVR